MYVIDVSLRIQIHTKCTYLCRMNSLIAEHFEYTEMKTYPIKHSLNRKESDKQKQRTSFASQLLLQRHVLLTQPTVILACIADEVHRPLQG